MFSYLSFIGFMSYILYMGFPEITYRKTDLIENYRLKAKEINELKIYVESITPKDKAVSLEFDKNSNFAIFHVDDNETYDQNWNVAINSKKADSLLTNSNAVVRLNHQEISISSQRNMTVTTNRIVTVYNKNGLGAIGAVTGYDKSRSLNGIEAIIYDAFGNEIRRKIEIVRE